MINDNTSLKLSVTILKITDNANLHTMGVEYVELLNLLKQIRSAIDIYIYL